MRRLRLVLLSILAFAVSLALSGCGSTHISSMAGSDPQAGTHPTVTAVALQEDLEPNNKQEVQFSEAMDPSTINAQTFTVRDSSGHLVGGVVSYDASYNIASFQPSPVLQPVAKYTATIATGVASAGGAHLTAPYTYTFTTTYNTTGDYNQPFSINSVSPAANATCVSATTAITITFDRPPDASTVNSTNIVVTDAGGASIPVTMSINVTTTQVVLTPASPLPSGTITVTVSNVGDLSDKMMASPYTWSFSTACSGGGGGGGGNTFVYVSGSPASSIAGFQVAADGSTTAVPGSPFALAGGFVAASPSGSFLFSDGQTGPGTGMTYYTYSVAADGSLSASSSTTEVTTDPSPFHPGVPPQALGWIATDRSGTTLYGEQVTGSSSSGDQWVGEYAIGSTGSLSLLGAGGAEYDHSPITFTLDNRFAYLVAIPPMSNPSVVSFLTRNSDGTLTGNGALNLAQPAGAPPASEPDYVVVSPNSNYLAVVYQQNDLAGFGTTSGIAVFPINSDGSAGTPTAFLPLTTGSAFGSWTLAWDSSGSYLFASDGSGPIYQVRFDSSTNTVTLVAQTTMGSDPEPVFFLNGHLFAVRRSAQNLYVYNFSNGVLTPAPGSPVPLGFTPFNVVALQH